MLLRKALIAALVVAPFVYSPSAVSAQRGLDRAAVATARADEVGAGQNSHANQDMPRGILQRFVDHVLPPGLRRTRPQEESEPVTEPDEGTTDPGTTDPGPTEPVCLSSHFEWSGFTYKEVCDVWDPPL